MKKLSTFLTLALAALMLFVSCTENGSVADMRIVLNSDTSRLIAPEGVPLEITSYNIVGSGPDGASFNFTTTKTSTTLSGVAVGEWTITATGLNANKKEIVQGSTTFVLSTSNPSVVVRLDSLIGEGNLSVSMSWNTSVISNPSIELELTAQGSDQAESIVATMNTSNGTASFTKASLPAGSYILQGRLYSSGILMSGFTEAVRIVGNETSSASIEFNLDNFPYAPGSIQLLDQSGIPVECSVSGLTSEVNAGEDIQVSLVPERANLNDITVKWYIDGELQGSGTNTTLNFTPGVHRVDAVAYTNKIGSYGSCSISLSALVKTEKGVPGNQARIDASTTGLKMGTNTVMKFLPDGKLIILSGANKSMQIASMLRNTVSIDKEYGTASLSALSGLPVDFDYHLIDGSGTYALVAAMNSSANSVRFNYISSTGEVKQIEQCNGYLLNYEGNTDKFSSSVGSVGFDALMNEFVFLGLDSNGKNTYLLERYVVSSAANNDYAYRGIDISTDINYSLGKDYTNLNTLAVSPDGERYIVGNESGNIAVLNHESYVYGSTTLAQKNGYKLPNLTSSFKGLKKIEFSSNGIAYLLGDDFIAAYNPNTDRELFFKTVSGESFTDMAINDVTENIYLLSAANQKVYSYPINGDGTIGEATIVETLNSSENIELSTDGSYLILYTKSAATSLEVMRIRTTS